ncbi:MAG: glycosyltransferase [Candidatus Heimdallarchaeaceae archaeon]
MLCDNGKLSAEIKNIIRREGLEEYVKLIGWASHEDIPNYLNGFKLLVLPSYTEGLLT